MALGEARVGEPPAKRRVGHLGGPRSQADSALSRTYGARVIDFDAAADEHVAVADRDGVGRGLIACSPDPHSRLTVWPADLDGETGEEQRHPRHVAVVLAGLVRATEDDVLDERRVEAGALDHRAKDGGGEIVRPDGASAPP